MLEVSLSSRFKLSLFCFVILLFTGNALIYTYLCSAALVTQSCVTLATPWTVSHQVPLSIEFSRQECQWWWFSLSVVSNSCDPMDWEPTRLLCPWDSPGKNTGVGCHCLLQGIFPTRGSNLGLLHCRKILYHHCLCPMKLISSLTLMGMQFEKHCSRVCVEEWHCGMI